MPKRYHVVKGNSFTWKYMDKDAKPPTVLAESHERWNSRQEVKAAINEMKKADVVDDP